MQRPVIREIGMAIGAAQMGGKSPAKPWKGEGPGVMEIASTFDSNAFRVVYTVTFKKAIYILHGFQKKSRRGAKTPKVDIGLISERLYWARQDYQQRYGKEAK
jgi:phage-related protein